MMDLFGRKKREEALNELRNQATLTNRMLMARGLGTSFDGKRNLYEVFGYNTAPTMENYKERYLRQDIASRVVDAPPKATWNDPPELEPVQKREGSRFLSKWEELVDQHNLWEVFERTDRLARLGRFSVLVLGTPGSLENPARNGDLLYCRPLDESGISQIRLDGSVTSERFGKPDSYQLNLNQPVNLMLDTGNVSILPTEETMLIKPIVHHSRCIHVIENKLDNEIFGSSIMAQVYNTLDDILKIAGSSAEIYWLAANRGIQADVDKDLDLSEEDERDLSKTLEDYQHQLRRVLRTRGVKLNVLDSHTPDPTGAFYVQIALLSSATGIPRRILLGAEEGQLASEQDRANWAFRIDERRRIFAETSILRPFISRMQDIGVLPKIEYKVNWNPAYKLTPLENAQAAASVARAVQNLSSQAGKGKMQITSSEEARKIVNLEGKLPESELIKMEEETNMGEENSEQGGKEANTDEPPLQSRTDDMSRKTE